MLRKLYFVVEFLLAKLFSFLFKVTKKVLIAAGTDPFGWAARSLPHDPALRPGPGDSFPSRPFGAIRLLPPSESPVNKRASCRVGLWEKTPIPRFHSPSSSPNPINWLNPAQCIMMSNRAPPAHTCALHPPPRLALAPRSLIYSNSLSQPLFLESGAKVSKALCDSGVHPCVFISVCVHVCDVWKRGEKKKKKCVWGISGAEGPVEGDPDRPQNSPEQHPAWRNNYGLCWSPRGSHTQLI